MTSDDIQEAYRADRMSRRSAIRGLVAVGMSLPVAIQLVNRWEAQRETEELRAEYYDDIARECNGL